MFLRKWSEYLTIVGDDVVIPIVEERVEVVGLVRCRGWHRRRRMLTATVTRGSRVLVVPRRRVVIWDVVVIPFGRVGTKRVEALPVDRLQYVLVRLRLVRLVVLLKMENGVENQSGGAA